MGRASKPASRRLDVEQNVTTSCTHDGQGPVTTLPSPRLPILGTKGLRRTLDLALSSGAAVLRAVLRRKADAFTEKPIPLRRRGDFRCCGLPYHAETRGRPRPTALKDDCLNGRRSADIPRRPVLDRPPNLSHDRLSATTLPRK